ncbi:MAG: imidazole glycerol phosphate synthase subunit HisH [Betaproteobacteria bacterium]|nr:imidazole glycerol phosphate synthase subunit HisH [Betaproteobacteria bacterium]
MNIAVIDYGMGNLRSVSKALTSDPAAVDSADRIVFPGQGAMPDCMREMDARGLRGALLAAARAKPFLGICIGLQMLFESSEEGGVSGLAVLPGRVRRFPAEAMHDERGAKLKVPHMGWNEVRQARPHALWAGIKDGERFYFVHSFFADTGSDGLACGRTVYGLPFTCAVARDNIFAVQFHPDKSPSAGLRLLANFVDWNS